MPIYEYLCEQCGTLMEKIQKFSDPPLTRCEKCEGKLSKVLSQSSFVLKGSGWYLSDYSKKSSAASAKDDSAGDAKPTGSAKSACDAKPAGGCGSEACAKSE